MIFDCSERVFKVIDANDKERFFKLFSYSKIRSKQIFYFYEVYEILYERQKLKQISELVYESKIYSDEYIFELSLQESGIYCKNIEEVKQWNLKNY